MLSIYLKPLHFLHSRDLASTSIALLFVRETRRQNYSNNRPTQKLKLSLIGCFEHSELQIHNFRVTVDLLSSILLREILRPIFQKYELQIRLVLIVILIARFFTI